MKDRILQPLKIMGLGMLAILVIVLILIIVVKLMSYFDEHKDTKKSLLIGLLCLVLVVVVGFSLIMQYVVKKPKEYLVENQIAEVVETKTVNDAMEKVDVKEDNFNCKYYQISDDSEDEKDLLYYTVVFNHNNDYVFGKINVVENSAFSFAEKFSGEIKSGKYKNKYEVQYSISLDYDEVLPLNEIFGFLKVGEQKIYYEFTTLATNESTDEQKLAKISDLLDQILIVE